ncbi:SusC/RagA family TonB-linked outer membrane protein [Parabacteroides pacaensis]|uniref:SusC/RagA family TonB-linked outer membrane protein n=1 Tax=Parabacteroides pacaensis TaxID=2086575 RepID=UPI000D0F395D|nr:TonB-dependent receptor [Parabacteroides pacaensis]
MNDSTLKQFYGRIFVILGIVFISWDILAADKSHEIPKDEQAKIQITGSVTDKYGPLPGVNVSIKGTALGVSTDVDGKFNIAIPDSESILVFQCIGYAKQEVKVGDRRVILIRMEEEITALEEVTVVAFGKQKKESVIGSITTLKPAELKRPTSNLTTTLAGNMAGIIAYQRSGEPGKDNADFFVRGITTFGTNTNPLILIDGIELTATDLARLQPDDIASFSVMKDATATALYGARGANGVILVTTKQGNVGPAKILVRVENSFSMPTKNIELADPITYMQMYNEAMLTRYRGDSGSSLDGLYSQEKIDNTIAGIDPVYYPNTNWQKELLKDYTTNQRANLSVSGGGGVARYYVSASVNHDNGMFKVDKRNNFNNNISNNSYTLRANVNIDLTKTTELIVRMNGSFDDYSGPVNGGTDMYDRILHSNPVLFPAYYNADEEHAFTKHIMFGNADRGQYINPYADLVRGYKELSRSQMQASIEAKQNLDFLIQGLSIRGMFNISRLSQFSVDRSYTPFYYKTTSRNSTTGQYHLELINENGTEYLGYNENEQDKVMNSTYYAEGTVNYDHTFEKKHGVSGLLVFMVRNTLNANTGNLQLSLPSRNVGLSGRATYSYDKRYFAEFNFGYNGSERFHKSKRFGFFPSAGVAWMISNEPFWKKIKPVVSTLKLRYSWGKVGNDQIGEATDRFFYLSQVNMNDANKGATFGEFLNHSHGGISISRYANPEIGWEVSTKNNYAIELGLWEKLTIIAEYFTEYRDKILMTRASVPTTMGLSATTRANLGAASGKGVDISLEYQHSFNKDLWASARANYTFARSKYEVYEEPAYEHAWLYHAGKSIHQMYGYIAERLFADDEEAANSPRQEIGNEIYGGGDIKYTDVNRDGVVNEKDIVPIGKSSIPEIVYGFGFSIGYKGMDLSAFFQGQANQSFYIDATKTSPFNGETQLLKAYADSHWSEDNQDMYALWPRLSTFVHGNNNVGSTWHLRDGTFLRLKQMEIGYTLPEQWKWQKKVRISNLRLYVSGTNLLLFSKFKLWDVEMGGNGLGYPLQRVFNLGLNITFN